jgi:hypothetical protein
MDFKWCFRFNIGSHVLFQSKLCISYSTVLSAMLCPCSIQKFIMPSPSSKLQSLSYKFSGKLFPHTRSGCLFFYKDRYTFSADPSHTPFLQDHHYLLLKSSFSLKKKECQYLAWHNQKIVNDVEFF